MRLAFQRVVTGLIFLASGSAGDGICFATSKTVERLDSSYVVEGWQTREGLPHNSIGSLVRTPEGYLWLATQVGLARFDGVRFALFDTGNTEAIRRKHIQALCVGRDGSLWIGTVGGGVVRWSLSDGFVRFAPKGLPANLVVEAVYEDKDGVLWIGSQGNGLYRVIDDQVSVFTTEDGLSSNSIAEIRGDSDGGLWLSPRDLVRSSSGDLMRLHEGTVTMLSTRDGLPSVDVQSLYETNDGDVIVATSAGLARWSGGPGFEVLDQADGLPSSHVWSVSEGPDGALWVATSAGLARVDTDSIGTIDGSGFVSPRVPLFLHADREGSIWVGTWDRGLIRARAARVGVLGRREGVVSDFVWAVQQTRDGAMWIATDAGVSRVQDGDVHVLGPSEGLPHETVRSVFEDSQGGVWLGTQGGGVCRYEDGSITAISRQDGLPDDVVYATYEDRHGTIWIGTAGGLASISNGVISVLNTHNGLASDVVRAILEDRGGHLLVATNSGLDVVEDGMARPYHEDLEGDFVLSVHEDPLGILWLGTNGSGLVAVRDDRVFRFLSGCGISQEVVYKVIQDQDDNLWLSGNTGVSRTARSELLQCMVGEVDRVDVMTIDARDGMHTAECNGGSQSSGCLAKDGSVWFPTMRGVVVIRPGVLAVEHAPPKVLVEEIAIDRQGFGPRDDISAPPGRGDMEIRYTALDLVRPGSVRFRYRLEGFDEGWVSAGLRRYAAYTNLPPGEYRFLVEARAGDGPWSTSGTGVEVRIEPRFYQTTMFYSACSLMVVVLVLGLYRLRVRHLRSRAEALQDEVDAALDKIKVLSGLLPICSGCKKIRDEEGRWHKIETYIGAHSEAAFTHGMCPSCHEKWYPGFDDRR